jgi:hypothetical protein
MGRKKHRHSDPPAAAADATVGGEHILDDGAKPVLFQVMEVIGRYVADWQPVDRMLRGLTPGMRGVMNFTPAAFGTLVAKMPIKWFTSEESAEFVADVAKEAVQIANRLVQEKGHVTPDEVADAVRTAAENVRAKKVLVGPLGDIHVPDCPTLRAYLAENGVEGKESTYGEELDHGSPHGYCCHERIKEKLRSVLPGQNASKDGRRPFLQRLGDMPEGELRDAVVEWVNATARDPHRLPTLLEALGEIDEDGELEAVMLLDDDVREQMIPLLRGRNAEHWMKDALRTVGGKLAEFDASLAPLVAARTAARTTKPRRSLLAKLIRGTTL